jgi:formiminoglutamase
MSSSFNITVIPSFGNKREVKVYGDTKLYDLRERFYTLFQVSEYRQRIEFNGKLYSPMDFYSGFKTLAELGLSDGNVMRLKSGGLHAAFGEDGMSEEERRKFWRQNQENQFAEFCAKREKNAQQDSPDDDPRLADTIEDGEDGDIVIVGFPHDEGVRRNGGRVGAADGPSAFRKALARFGTAVNLEFGGVDLRSVRVTDAGDVDASVEPLERAHEQLEAIVARVLARGATAFVVGGGNDQSYPNACALLRQVADDDGGGIHVVNVDAHLDARPLKENRVHSGSPFRSLLLDARFQGVKHSRFTEFALQGHQCSSAQAKWVAARGGHLIWLTDLEHQEPLASASSSSSSSPVSERYATQAGRAFAKHVLEPAVAQSRPLFFSFDIDSIRAADAPGVSCTSSVGLSARDAFDMSVRAGASGAVRLVDVSELNPRIEGHSTPRLVAGIFYHFVLGVAIARDNKIN